MILQALVNVLDAALAAMVGTMPGTPSWMDGFGASGAGILQNFINAAARWSFIIPFETIGTVFVISLAAAGLAIAIKVLRIIASYLTLGGGM